MENYLPGGDPRGLWPNSYGAAMFEPGTTEEEDCCLWLVRLVSVSDDPGPDYRGDEDAALFNAKGGDGDGKDDEDENENESKEEGGKERRGNNTEDKKQEKNSEEKAARS